VNLNTKQYASAYHYFSVAINLKPDFSNSYMYLGITLNRLNDFESSDQAFRKALDLESTDCTIHLNYAVTLYNHGYIADAKLQFEASEKLY